MSYELMAVRKVSNHYGPRDTGGTTGQLPTSGAIREVYVDFSAVGPLVDELWIPAGSEVIEVNKFGTLTSATLKTVDAAGANVVADVLSASRGDAISGKIVAGGQTAGHGKVVVRYISVA